MTRINVVPVKELHPKHLVAEYREIVRVFALSRKDSGKIKAPEKYVLGTGHVRFFYDKLGFVLNRYHALISEMVRRGYNPKPVDLAELIGGIYIGKFNDYIPTAEALALNRERIADRMPKGSK